MPLQVSLAASAQVLNNLVSVHDMEELDIMGCIGKRFSRLVRQEQE